jgi:hypothetical protein
VGVPGQQQVSAQLLGLVLQSLLVAPGNYLMPVDHSDFDPAELEGLGNTQRTF